jgi:tyrosine-protein kinase Etk/Wzc
MEPRNPDLQGTQEEAVPLLRFFRILWRYRWMEIAIVFAASAAAMAYSLLLPKQYEATASVLPPADPRAGRSLEALVGQAASSSPLSGLLQSGGSRDVFVGILKSRTMQDDTIRRFDLVKVYKLDGTKAPMRTARVTLERMTNVRISREGVISITALAYDPQMAADIANFYVENLDSLNTALNVTEAGRSRLFLESRVAEAQKALKVAEDRLRAYQSKSKAVVMEGQTKAAIEGTAKLEGQILAAEVQLKTLETYSTARNPDVIKLKESIEEMRRQLKRMEHGRGEQRTEQRAEGRGQRAANTKQKAEDRGQRAETQQTQQAQGTQQTQRAEGGATEEGRGGADFSMPLGMIPETGLELARMIREAKIQETIFTLLTQQLEQAKIAEAKDTPTVRILDRAIPAETKSRPWVTGNVIAAAAISFFLAGCLAVFLESMRKTRRGFQAPCPD